MRKLLILPGSHIIVWGYRRRSGAHTFSRSYVAYGEERKRGSDTEERQGMARSAPWSWRNGWYGSADKLWYIPAIFFDHRAPRRFISAERTGHLIASYYLPKDSNIVTLAGVASVARDEILLLNTLKFVLKIVPRVSFSRNRECLEIYFNFSFFVCTRKT